MSEFTQIVFAITGYRVFIIATGVIFAYLGYKLFCKGIYEQSGDLQATWGKYTLVLRQAAPGIFFALFGVIVISVSLVRGIDIERINSLPLGPYKRGDFLTGLFLGEGLTEEMQVIVQKLEDGVELKAEEKKLLGSLLQLGMQGRRDSARVSAVR